jgi:hypothetical protein
MAESTDGYGALFAPNIYPVSNLLDRGGWICGSRFDGWIRAGAFSEHFDEKHYYSKNVPGSDDTNCSSQKN